METILIGFVVNPEGFTIRSLILITASNLECLVFGTSVVQYCRLFFLMTVALHIAVVISIDADVVILFLLRDRDARIGILLLLTLRRRQARGYQQ